MLSASVRDSSCANLAAIGDVFAQGRYIFIVNVGDLISAEAAGLFLKLLI